MAETKSLPRSNNSGPLPTFVIDLPAFLRRIHLCAPNFLFLFTVFFSGVDLLDACGSRDRLFFLRVVFEEAFDSFFTRTFLFFRLLLVKTGMPLYVLKILTTEPIEFSQVRRLHCADRACAYDD